LLSVAVAVKVTLEPTFVGVVAEDPPSLGPAVKDGGLLVTVVPVPKPAAATVDEVKANNIIEMPTKNWILVFFIYFFVS
jgi:hypothetical protein